MLATLIAATIKCVHIMNVALAGGGFMTWAERKQSAMMQDRLGANRASIFGIRAMGLFHIVTDALKMLTKEDYFPPSRDRFLFWAAPIIAGCASLIGFVVVPFGPVIQVLGHEVPLVIMRSEIGMLILFGALGLTIYGAFLAGVSADNKWMMLGGLRASAQMVAYEVVLGLSLVGVFMVYQTMDLSKIADGQQGWLGWAPFLPNWGVFHQPLAFLLFCTAALAETKRTPFDMPEGESEIIGYFVEYSGMRFGLFLMSEFIETILFGAVITVVFLGGWHLPGVNYADMPWYVAIGVSQGIFWGKVVGMCWFSLLIRWTLPRFRYDQLLDLGWKIMLPTALANILLTAGVLMWKGNA